mgnify:CR=1 FL=1
MIQLNIGFDDTDSLTGGCTTYIGARLVHRLEKEAKAQFTDYPNLIRLNPNIPYKTRGNGAVCLRIKIEENMLQKVEEIVIEEIEENSDFKCEKTHPGIVFLQGPVPPQLKTFAEKALTDVITLEEAIKTANKVNAKTVTYKKGRGIIGALAAIGNTLENDHTYELLSYRTPEHWGTPRTVDTQSIYLMDKLTHPETFNNIDHQEQRILITPRGPDPVLYGIRGETPEIVKLAHKIVVSYEPIERWVIYRTNQGTDEHLNKTKLKKIKDIKPYTPTKTLVKIIDTPKTIPGGHVIVKAADQTGTIHLAAYEPTGNFRKIIKKLIPGDTVIAYGTIKPKPNTPLTLNLEKIEIIKLAPKIIYKNPKCPKCGKTMESAGKNQGYRCKKCKTHIKNITKQKIQIPRQLKPGTYLPTPKAHRHLTKPLQRYNKTNKTKPTKLIPKWHHP